MSVRDDRTQQMREMAKGPHGVLVVEYLRWAADEIDRLRSQIVKLDRPVDRLVVKFDHGDGCLWVATPNDPTARPIDAALLAFLREAG